MSPFTLRHGRLGLADPCRDGTQVKTLAPSRAGSVGVDVRSAAMAGRRSISRLLLAAALLAGCSSAPTTTQPSPNRNEIYQACLADSGGPVEMPELPEVIRVVDGVETIHVLAGPVPAIPSLTYLSVCRIARDAKGTITSSSSSTGSIGSPVDPNVSVDSSSGSGVGAATSRSVAGRVGPAVTRVDVVLADGTSAQSAIANGYFVAFWRSTAELVAVAAFDASDTQLARLDGARLHPDPSATSDMEPMPRDIATAGRTPRAV